MAQGCFILPSLFGKQDLDAVWCSYSYQSRLFPSQSQVLLSFQGFITSKQGHGLVEVAMFVSSEFLSLLKMARGLFYPSLCLQEGWKQDLDPVWQL